MKNKKGHPIIGGIFAFAGIVALCYVTIIGVLLLLAGFYLFMPFWFDWGEVLRYYDKKSDEKSQRDLKMRQEIEKDRRERRDRKQAETADKQSEAEPDPPEESQPEEQKVETEPEKEEAVTPVEEKKNILSNVPIITEDQIIDFERFYKVPDFEVNLIINYDLHKCFSMMATAKRFNAPDEYECIAIFASVFPLPARWRYISFEIIAQMYEASEKPVDALVSAFSLCARGTSDTERAINDFCFYMMYATDKDREIVRRFYPFVTDDKITYYIAELFFIAEKHEDALQAAFRIESYFDDTYNTPLLIARIYREIDPAMSAGYLQELIESGKYPELQEKLMAELTKPLLDIKNSKRYDKTVSAKKAEFDKALFDYVQGALISRGIIRNPNEAGRDEVKEVSEE